jgi:AraC-like DNA-binding protein
MKSQPPQEKVKFWLAQDLNNLELLRAKYITHTFSRHTHDGYAIGIIERGAETFYYRGGIHTAPAGSIVVINPGEIHTGQATDETGWTYRMLYPTADLVQRAAAEVQGRWRNIPDFPQPVIRDKYLVNLIRQLHIVLEQSTSTLERETHFISTLAQMIARHADGRPRFREALIGHQAVKQAREYLDAHFTENVTLAQLTAITGLSPFHLTRTFREIVGLPPHLYLTQVRVERAKTLLSQGWPLTHVAMETGFFDQSHFTKRFKRIVGVTPGQYVTDSKNVQDNLAWVD